MPSVRSQEETIETYGEVHSNCGRSNTLHFKSVFVGSILLLIIENHEEVPIGTVYHRLYDEVLKVAAGIDERKFNE